jgi:hypothetical protein
VNKETLAREWLDHGNYEAGYSESEVLRLAGLLRSRDKRVLRIVEEVRAGYTNGANNSDERFLNAGGQLACDEIKRRLEESDV